MNLVLICLVVVGILFAEKTVLELIAQGRITLNDFLYNELGKFDKERCEYYYRQPRELAKFKRVGGE